MLAPKNLLCQLFRSTFLAVFQFLLVLRVIRCLPPRLPPGQTGGDGDLPAFAPVHTIPHTSGSANRRLGLSGTYGWSDRPDVALGEEPRVKGRAQCYLFFLCYNKWRTDKGVHVFYIIHLPYKATNRNGYVGTEPAGYSSKASNPDEKYSGFVIRTSRHFSSTVISK